MLSILHDFLPTVRRATGTQRVIRRKAPIPKLELVKNRRGGPLRMLDAAWATSTPKVRRAKKGEYRMEGSFTSNKFPARPGKPVDGFQDRLDGGECLGIGCLSCHGDIGSHQCLVAHPNERGRNARIL